MASEYAKYVVDERAKRAINHPVPAYNYACNVIGGRWCQAELIIMKDPKTAYEYAQEIGRAHV